MCDLGEAITHDLPTFKYPDTLTMNRCLKGKIIVAITETLLHDEIRINRPS